MFNVHKIISVTKNITVLGTSLLIGGTLLEVGLRIVDGLPAAPWIDYRQIYLERHIAASEAASANSYDETLGWVLTENRGLGTEFSTIEHGIRQNNRDTVLVEEGILATGDSFTAGSEVGNSESWPAHLEDLLNRPVMNGGVGGYATDQIILRAEKLIPELSPKIVILGFLDQDILRSGYSLYGAPKPWYSLSQNGLELHNVPAPRLSNKDFNGKDKNPFLYSVAVLKSLAGNPIWTPPGSAYKRVSNDPVAVTCALLERIKFLTYKKGIHLLLVMQYGGYIHALGGSRSTEAKLVLDCARHLSIIVIDEFDTIRDIAKSSLEELQTLYVMHNKNSVYGHMSSAGNRLVAGLIADSVNNLPYAPTPSKGTTDVNARKFTEFVESLLKFDIASGDFEKYGNAILKIEKYSETAFRLSTVGHTGEHFISLPTVNVEYEGLYEFHLQIKAGSTNKIRLQMWHSNNDGIISDFDLENEEYYFNRHGALIKAGASIKASGEEDTWKNVKIFGEFPKGEIRLIVQPLSPNGENSIPGNGTDFYLSKIDLKAFGPKL